MDELRKGIKEEIIASCVGGGKESSGRRGPKELKKEASKDMISGYSCSEADNNVVNKLVNKMTKSKGLEVAAVDKKNVVIDCPSTESCRISAEPITTWPTSSSTTS